MKTTTGVIAAMCALVSSGCSSGETGGPGTDAGSGDATGAETSAFDIGSPGDGDECPLPFDAVDCKKACEHFFGWCETTACASPYCESPGDCETACSVTKGSTRFSNVLFGCAGEAAECSAFQACQATKKSCP